MIVPCEKCEQRYDDEYRWTVCPHLPLEAAPDGLNYCRQHDLFNCRVCRDNTGINLICPSCGGSLTKGAQHVFCDRSSEVFFIEDGIIDFRVGYTNDYSNESYTEDQIKGWLLSSSQRLTIKGSKVLRFLNELRIRFSLSGRRDRIFRKGLKKTSARPRILDIGCGGGRHYYCDYGYVVGIDPVHALLKQAKGIYDQVYMGSCTHLPFADASFDYVVSSDVLGHIAPAYKEATFKEMYRVLKPGGRAIHAIESEATSPWFKFAHKHPALYQDVFVDRPGHVGMELPSEWRARFVKAGFREIMFDTISRVIQEPGNISYWFREYRGSNRWIDALCFVDRILCKSFVVKQLLNFLLEPISQLEALVTPEDYGNGVLVVFEKPYFKNLA
jgi:ubiquinone/menaquinone biosynthesis C-methylase UbiE